MSLPRYPKYKDSGVEWLGEVPEHWDASKLGFVAWVRARLGWKGLKADEYVEDGVAFLATPNIKGSTIDFEDVNFITRERFEESPEIKLRKGDVLLAKDGSTLGTVNIVEHLPRPATVNGSIAVITPERERLLGRFLYYLFGSAHLGHTIRRVKGGMGVPHLFQSDLRKFDLLVPPLPEQDAIVAFLDRETAKIDALVAEQERLIELLKEKRQAVISQAVTKGLTPKVPMKESGVEWLGEIPAHWKVVRLGYVARVENGTTPSRDNLEYWADGDVPWLSSGEVNQYRITEASEFITRKALAECSLRLLPVGTIVVGMIGQGRTRGMAATMTFEATINQNLAAIIPDTSLLSDYLLHTFEAAYVHLREFGRGGQQAALNSEILRAVRVPLPPAEEQSAICAHLAARLGEFDGLSSEAEQAIDLLQERRTALISAAVTGQIDVRKASGKAA